MEVPMITGRIDALPVLMFSWNCPKCGAFHFKVNKTMHNGEEVVACLNKKCGEFFERTQFRFNHEDKIARVLASMKEEMYKFAVEEAEGELRKEEEANALTS